MREQVLKLGAERQDGFVDDKIYRGMNSYVDHRAGFRKVGRQVAVPPVEPGLTPG